MMVMRTTLEQVRAKRPQIERLLEERGAAGSESIAGYVGACECRGPNVPYWAKDPTGGGSALSEERDPSRKICRW